MPSQALYRKWRSRTFAEIIGQEHVTQTLLNELRAGRIGHAYLFTGPRGTGKTSTARVLARAVNCLDPQDGEPCNRCIICRSLNEGRSLDFIEIDGASNTGVDDVRDLREKVGYAPSECRYKVYVVDEVHMLSDSAFNALLKTLEEPPPHVIFILATTNPEKIPLTVLSRCQRFDFRRVSLPNLRQKLLRICSEEHVNIDTIALDAVARYATGSFRDAESLLDQLISYDAEQITLDDVRRILGSAPEEVIAGIVDAVIVHDAGAGLRLINVALDSGVEPRQLTREVLEHLRALLLLKNGGAALLSVPPETLRQMMAQSEGLSARGLLETVRLFNQAGNQIKTGVHGQLPLEMALVEATLLDNVAVTRAEWSPTAGRTQSTPTPVSAPDVHGPPSRDEQSVIAPDVNKSEPRLPQAEIVVPTLTDSVPPAPETPQASTTQMVPQELSVAWLQENWGRLLQTVRPHSRSVEALLKSCEPASVQDDVVTLGFYHAFHKERMDEEKNRVEVEKALIELAGKPYRVKCVLAAGDRQNKEQESETNRREKLLDNPMVNEAITRYGAKVIDVQ